MTAAFQPHFWNHNLSPRATEENCQDSWYSGLHWLTPLLVESFLISDGLSHLGFSKSSFALAISVPQTVSALHNRNSHTILLSWNIFTYGCTRGIKDTRPFAAPFQKKHINCGPQNWVAILHFLLFFSGFFFNLTITQRENLNFFF